MRASLGGFAKLFDGDGIDPLQSPGFKALTMIGVLLVGVAGTAASFNGLMGVAGWAQLEGVMAITVAVVVDGAIWVFTCAAIWNHAQGKGTLTNWAAVGLYTSLSVVANVIYVIDASSDEPLHRIIGGAVVKAVMPITIWVVTHTATTILIKKRVGSAAERRQHAIDLELEYEATRSVDADLRLFHVIKNLPESSRAGTPERECFLRVIQRTYEAQGGNMTKVADQLEVSYSRVVNAVEPVDINS